MASGQITLVPTTLKEASLDSPTFRGTVLHYAEQVELVEKWLDTFIKASTKLVSDVISLEDSVNGFLCSAVPTNVSESAVDHDYTLRAMQRYTEGSLGFWTNIIVGARRVEKVVVEPLLAFQRGEVKNFRETHRLLEAAQTKYDALLVRYLSQSKSKEPSALREDAFSLYEARKAYMKTCFDFCVAAPVFRSVLDRLLTKVVSNQWADQVALRKDTTGLVERCGTDIERIRSCYDSMEANENVFRKQLMTARTELERRTKREYQPARELDEYAVSTVPYLTSRPAIAAALEGQEVASEKQGWLFMRTLSGKPARSVWIRRWFFIKGGIFGWLVQGFRGGGVEESEKVGVLLCNIKPAFQEERRFCFEVKTKDTTILLQTETQADLTSWLAVFEQAKRSAVESSSVVASSQAFSIIPPTAPAPPSEPGYVTRGHDGNTAGTLASIEPHSLLLRSPRNDDALVFSRASTMEPSNSGGFTRAASSDFNRSLTDTTGKHEPHRKTVSAVAERSISPSGLGISSAGGISALIAASHNALPFQPDPVKAAAVLLEAHKVSSLAPSSLSSTPSPSNLLTAATVTSGGSIASASDRTPVLEKGHRKTMSLDFGYGKEVSVDGSQWYFPGYPPALKMQDEHFRMLFPGTKDHPVMLVFCAIWSPNDKQELPGRCFVTDQNLYFYSHYLGMVFANITPLTTVQQVKAAPEKDCDYLFLHLIPDTDDDEAGGPLVTIKTFLEPLRLLQRRLHLLVTNAQAKPMMSSKELLQKLMIMEKEAEEKSRSADEESWEDVGLYMDGNYDERGRRRAPAEEFKLKIDDDIGRTIDDRAREVKLKLPTAPVNYTPLGMTRKSLEREFPISSKALFYVMFGEKSNVFQTLYAQRRAQPISQSPWKELDKGKARRQFAYHTSFLDIFGRSRRADIVDHQTIEKQDEHLCYVVTDIKTPWHLPHRTNFIMVSKIVITFVDKGRSKLSIWTRVDWFRDPLFSKGIVQQQAYEDLENDALDLGDVVAEAIRKLGRSPQIHNAIAVFGSISSSSPSPLPPPTPRPIPQPITTATITTQIQTPPIRQHQLSEMLLENGLSFAESAISSIIMFVVACIRGVRAHWALILLLTASVGCNFALGGKATTAWWSERRAEGVLNRMWNAPSGVMVRAITLGDVYDAVGGNGSALTPGGAGTCWRKFVEEAESGDGGGGGGGRGGWGISGRLQRGREGLGRVRHELVVALRVINALEKDLVRAEWERWIWRERERCRKILALLEKKEAGEIGERVREYCGECEAGGEEGLAVGRWVGSEEVGE